MTQHKAFYQMLDGLAVLFDVEASLGGDEAASALRSITSKSHMPLPPGHDVLPEVEKQALSIDPLPVCKSVSQTLPLLDWHFPGLEDGRIREELARQMATVELIGPDGMISHPSVRVGLFMQSAGVNYVTRKHTAEETIVMLCGSGKWSINDEAPTKRQPGDYIRHPSNTPHYSVTVDKPFIAAWRWTGAIGYDQYELTG